MVKKILCIFELMLRLKANYFWPAMWDSRFNEDDAYSPQMADEMGIVMGTSHHEPMMRAHKEYVYRKDSIGAWDYSIPSEGTHTVKVVMVDPEIVVEKLVINPDNEHPSYHGKE